MDKKNTNILIVEDSLTQSEQLKHILEESGFSVKAVSDGRRALNVLGEYTPNIVISDIIMPGMDGYELCLKIKKDDKLKSIPVILLTSLSGIEDVVRGLEAGANNFIIKPYKEEYLLERVRQILENCNIRGGETEGKSVEIFFKGRKYLIASKPYQVVDFLLSTYETAVEKNEGLLKAEERLITLNEQLKGTNKDLEKEITVRKKTEEELQRSNTDLEQFAYVASHDLQEPLRVVSGYLDLLYEKNKEKLDKEDEEYITHTINATKHMGGLIKGLLEYSRVGREIVLKPVNCGEVLNKSLSNLKVATENNNAVIKREPLPEVMGDELLLHQLFQNLIGNAIKFHGDKTPEIEVKAERKDNNWLFSIKDNGRGFDQKNAESIFTIFHRLEKDKGTPGTGIGLAICTKIVELHGGKLWAQSAPGEGSVFYFTIPAM